MGCAPRLLSATPEVARVGPRPRRAQSWAATEGLEPAALRREIAADARKLAEWEGCPGRRIMEVRGFGAHGEEVFSFSGFRSFDRIGGALAFG